MEQWKQIIQGFDTISQQRTLVSTQRNRKRRNNKDKNSNRWAREQLEWENKQIKLKSVLRGNPRRNNQEEKKKGQNIHSKGSDDYS